MGILRLISRNPKRDAYQMGGRVSYEGKRRSALLAIKDASPLRDLYLSKSDDIIYSTVKNFFTAASDVLWKNVSPDSYIRKTVGVQALFDLLRNLVTQFVATKDIRVNQFADRLKPAGSIDFSDGFFQTSGTGRQRIRNCLELRLGLKALGDIQADQEEYRRLVG